MIHAAVEVCRGGRRAGGDQHRAVDPRHVRRAAGHVAHGPGRAGAGHRRRRARHRRAAGDGLRRVVAARVVRGHGEGERRVGQRPGRAGRQCRSARATWCAPTTTASWSCPGDEAAWALDQARAAGGHARRPPGPAWPPASSGVDIYGLRGHAGRRWAWSTSVTPVAVAVGRRDRDDVEGVAGEASRVRAGRGGRAHRGRPGGRPGAGARCRLRPGGAVDPGRRRAARRPGVRRCWAPTWCSPSPRRRRRGGPAQALDAIRHAVRSTPTWPPRRPG